MSFSLIGILLLYPLQNVNALSLEDLWKKTEDTVVTAYTIMSQIPECIKKFEAGTDADCINTISQELQKLAYSNTAQFLSIISTFSQLPDMLNQFINNEISNELEKISPELIELGVDSYISSVAGNLQELGYIQLLVYADEVEIDRLEKNQGFITESIITGTKSFFIYDLETRKAITLDESARKFVEQNPLLRDSDFGKDPVRAGLMLFFDGEYLFIAPIIPISDEQLISLEEYCKLEIDSEKCEKAKAYLKLASMASKARDPTLFIPAAKAFMGIVQEINNETNAGLDEEINFVNELLSIKPETLANAKLIRTSNGEYISLHQASTLEYDEETISIAQSALNYMTNDENKKKKQFEQDLITVINSLDKLSNQ